MQQTQFKPANDRKNAVSILHVRLVYPLQLVNLFAGFVS